jgi:hypothetical protein
MITNNRPAARDAAGSVGDAFSWQATHFEYEVSHSAAQARLAETRVRFAGRSYIVRYDSGDPNWRKRALAKLDPLSDTAFALRKAPLTIAERAQFDTWAEAEMRRIWQDLP